MGMDDAVETITQVLSVIDRTPTPYESVCPVPENALNHMSTLIRNLRSGSSTTRISLRPVDRAKLPDYIEVILHCKEASPLPVGLDVHISLLRTKFRSSLTDGASIRAAGHRCKKVCVRHASLMNIARVLSHGNDTVVFDAMSSSVS